MYIHGSPLDAVFVELRRIQTYGPQFMFEGIPIPVGTAWSYRSLKFLVSSKLPFGGEDDLLVWPHTRLRSICKIVGDPVDWAVFTLDFAAVGNQRRPARPKPPKLSEQEIADLMRQFGWLRREDFEKPRKAAKGSRARGRTAHDPPTTQSSSSEESARHSGDDDAPASHGGEPRVRPELPMRDEVTRIREEFGEDAAPEVKHFEVHVLRGRWTEEHTGFWWDRLGARPLRGGLSTEWASKYFYSTGTTWARRSHTEEGCLLLADEFCRRGEYFIQMWMEHCIDKGWDFRYTQEHFDAYSPDLTHLEWAVTVRIGSATYTRLTELTNMFPRMRAVGH